MGREWSRFHVLPDTSPETLADLRCGDYIVLPGHTTDKPSRWVGLSSGGVLWAKHYPDTSDDQVASLASGLPEPARTEAFAALERPRVRR